jgi:hypothetical protein
LVEPVRKYWAGHLPSPPMTAARLFPEPDAGEPYTILIMSAAATRKIHPQFKSFLFVPNNSSKKTSLLLKVSNQFIGKKCIFCGVFRGNCGFSFKKAAISTLILVYSMSISHLKQYTPRYY